MECYVEIMGLIGNIFGGNLETAASIIQRTWKIQWYWQRKMVLIKTRKEK